MAQPKHYIWKGPDAAIELWPVEGVGGAAQVAAPTLSTMARSGARLPVALDPDHPHVRSWLAFGLVEAAPDDAAEATIAPADHAPMVEGLSTADENADPTASRRGRRN